MVDRDHAARGVEHAASLEAIRGQIAAQASDAGAEAQALRAQLAEKAGEAQQLAHNLSVVQNSTADLHEAVELERGRSSEVQERSDALKQAHAALVREEEERARARRLEVAQPNPSIPIPKPWMLNPET